MLEFIGINKSPFVWINEMSRIWPFDWIIVVALEFIVVVFKLLFESLSLFAQFDEFVIELKIITEPNVVPNHIW